mgnify:FL=1
MRFWKMDKVQGLIETQLQRLSEIESIVAEAKLVVKRGASPELTETIELAKQGDQLLERVALVRDLYADLLRTHAKEMKIR